MDKINECRFVNINDVVLVCMAPKRTSTLFHYFPIWESWNAFSFNGTQWFGMSCFCRFSLPNSNKKSEYYSHIVAYEFAFCASPMWNIVSNNMSYDCTFKNIEKNPEKKYYAIRKFESSSISLNWNRNQHNNKWYI